MCYDNDARPPDAPGNKVAASGEDITLTAADGTAFMAYVARSAEPKNAQVLIYPDVRGLHQFYKSLAICFAEVGYDALAIDYFGRTAGTDDRGDDFEFMPHVQLMEVPHFYEDVRAAMAFLREGAGADKATFVVGFCRGGSLAIVSGGEDFGFAGIIPFYSGLARQLTGTDATVLELGKRVKVPTLGLFGGNDPGIPPADVQQLDANLAEAGVEHEIKIYDGAPHSFFDRKQEEFAAESADAWRRTLAFIAAHS